MRSAVRGIHGATTPPAWNPRPSRRPPQQMLDVQLKPLIGSVKDPLEREADRIADAVVSGVAAPSVAAAPSSIQAKCAACEADEVETVRRQVDEEDKEEEDQLQLKAAGGGPRMSGAAAAAAAVAQGGRPLSSAERTYFEPRFGRDFSAVQIHDDARAGALSRKINARAFTHRNHIYFAPGALDFNSSAGRHLLAHELTHTVQQASETHVSLQRMVASNSSCPANVHNAPADPIAALTTVDELAQNMALAASHLLFLESLTFNDPTFGRSFVFNAYEDWFGTPQQTSSGAWRSRFRTATFATEEEAMAHEMQTLSDRYRKVHDWLAGDIRYLCPGTGRYTIPGCSPGPCGTRAAESCHTGTRMIGICPNFWLEPAPSDRSQAALLIHEALHARFGFRLHPTATARGRGRNPGCYQGLVLDIYGTGLTPGDCDRI